MVELHNSTEHQTDEWNGAVDIKSYAIGMLTEYPFCQFTE